MASLQLTDLLARRLDILSQNQIAISATGTFLLFNTPSGISGPAGGSLKQTCVAAIVLTNPVTITGTLTASIGSGSVATDFLGSTAITLPTSGNDTIYLAPNTTQLVTSAWLAYGYGVPINLKITAAAGANSALSVVVLGWIE